MTVVRDRRSARRARELLIATWGAALLVLAFSLPVLGAPPGPTKLLSSDVSPRATDSATPVTFSVTYRNAHALPPDYVRVAVGGATYAMTGSGTDWKAGVVFTVTTTLPAGSHDVLFQARDAERFIDELAAGSVTIAAAPPPSQPPPGPEPTPVPTDPPDSTPASGGTSGGSSGGGSTGGTDGSAGSGSGSAGSGSGAGTIDADGWDDLRGTGRGPAGMDLDGSLAAGGSTDGNGTGGTGNGEASADPLHQLPWFINGLGWTSGDPGSVGQGDGSGATGGGGDSAAGRGDWTGLDGQGAGGSSVDSASASGAAGGSGREGGPVAWIQSSLNGGLAALGLSGSGQLQTIPAVVGSTVLVTTWMAFMIFNKRRRDGEPPAPDGVLQAAAATGIGMGLVFAPAPVAPPDPEALMPRWRRPSLLEARKTDPIRSPAPARPRLTFAMGVAGVQAGGERRAIRYAVIPLLDRPDEILASRIGELVAGDEVQVEQRSGAYCHVLCPDGRRGWIHRTTLGDLVDAPAYDGGRVEAEPEAEDVLAAMLARGAG